MNLVDINTLFGTEDKCRELLVRLRFPEGPMNPAKRRHSYLSPFLRPWLKQARQKLSLELCSSLPHKRL